MLYKICTRIIFLVIFLCLFTAFRTSQSLAASAGYQRCSIDSTCTIGEYLYDDAYDPIIDATCTLTSRYPDGSSFLSSQAMTAAAEDDGWYSYEFSTVGKVEGVYRSQITCVSGGDTLRLDKTFIISTDASGVSSEDISSAVWDASASAHNQPGSFGNNLQSPAASVSGIWSYPARTLTSFGTLIDDIWSYSSRSLTTFGSLIADIWSNGTRTLTGGSFATKEDVDLATSAAALSIKGASNKDLTQVSASLTTIEGKIDTLTTTVGTINTNTSALLTKWGSYSAADIIGYIDGLETGLGTNADNCAATTVFGGLRCIQDKWGSQTASDLYTAANNAATTAAALRAEINYTGKATNAYDDIQAIKTYVSAFDSLTSGEVTAAVWDAAASGHTTAGTFGYKLQNAVPSVSDIWSHPTRTLSSFGSLISDIWSYSSRSLTDFGSLIADIWSNPTRTLSSAALDSGGSLSTKSDLSAATTSAVTSIKGASNKDLTEVSTSLSAAQASLNSIEGKIDILDTNIDSLTTSVSTLISKWGSYSAADIIGYVDGLETGLGTSADNCAATTVFGGIACVKDKWGVQTAASLYTAANNAATTAAALRAELDYNGKSSTAFEDIQSIKTFANTLNTNIGSSTDLSSASTVFGKIQGAREDVAASITSIKGPNNKSLSDVSTEVAGVQTTANSISTKVDSLDTKVTTLNTTANSILTKWSTYTMADVITAVNSMSTGLGSSSDTCVTNTVFGQVKCVVDKWGSRSAEDIYTKADTAATTITSLRAELNYNGKSTTAYEDLQTLIANLSSVSTSIGAQGDSAATATLYGRIKKVQETTENLDTSGAGFSTLLDKWGDLNAEDIYDKVKDLSSGVSDSNSISGVSDILSLVKTNATDMTSLKNSVLSLQALVEANKKLLENGATRPIIQTWLEEGSIIFNTLITNPSSVTQTVPVKFYLPKEASIENIMKIDKGLSIGYDPTEDALYVTGQVTLAPNGTKIYSVEVEDIWKVSQQEIASLKLQAKELYEPLKGTSYFAQGATLYADVISSLDQAAGLQKESQTPESRIKSYRDAKIHTDKARQEIEDLKTLGASVSAGGNLLGFVGGVQTFAVWGMVIILVAGFIFLALYMRQLSGGTAKKSSGGFSIKDHLKKLDRKTIMFGMGGIGAILIVIVISQIVPSFLKKSTPATDPVVNEDVQKKEKGSDSKPEEVMVKSKDDVLGASIANDITLVSSGSAINLRQGPSVQTPIVAKLKPGARAHKLSDSEGWIKIEIYNLVEKKIIQGWIRNDFIELDLHE